MTEKQLFEMAKEVVGGVVAKINGLHDPRMWEEAWDGVIEAIITWNGESCSLKSWMWKRAWWKVCNAISHRHYEQAPTTTAVYEEVVIGGGSGEPQLPPSLEALINLEPVVGEFSYSRPDCSLDFVEGLKDLLSADAMAVVDLVLSTDVLQVITEPGASPCQVRKALRHWLRKQGWSKARVSRALRELKEAFAA